MREEKMKGKRVPYKSKEEAVFIYQTDNDTLQLDVQMADETVRITGQQPAELFQKDRIAITLHTNSSSSEYESEEKRKGAFFAFPFFGHRQHIVRHDVKLPADTNSVKKW